MKINKVLSLTKVFLKSSFKFNYNRKKAETNAEGESGEVKGGFRKVVTYIGIAILVLYMMSIFGFLSYGMIVGLKEVGQEAVFLGIFMLVIAFLTIFQTIFSSINIFYFSKDINYILPLPLKPYEILMSKFNVLLITEYVTEFVFALVPFILYGILTSSGAMFYIYGFLILLIFPILPAIFATVLVMIIMTFSKFTKNKDKFRLVTGLLAVVFAVGIQFVTNSNTELTDEAVVNMLMKANGMVEMLGRYFITIRPAVDTLINANAVSAIVSFIELLAITLAAYIIFIVIGQKLYFRGVVGNTVSESGKSRKVKDKEYSKRRVGLTYISKEIKILCRNPIYFMQCVLPSLLIPIVFTVIFTVNKGMGEAITLLKDMNIYTGYFVCIIIGLIEFYSMMSFIAITAISRDGESAIFTKYIPIKLYDQFIYKIAPGVIFNIIPTVFVIGILIFLFPAVSVIYIMTIFIIATILNMLQNYLMFIVDLKRPKLQWDSEYAVVKQNMNMIFEFIFAFVIIGILVLVGVLLRNVNFTVSIAALAIILGVATVLIDGYVHRRQNELFEKIR